MLKISFQLFDLKRQFTSIRNNRAKLIRQLFYLCRSSSQTFSIFSNFPSIEIRFICAIVAASIWAAFSFVVLWKITKLSQIHFKLRLINEEENFLWICLNYISHKIYVNWHGEDEKFSNSFTLKSWFIASNFVVRKRRRKSLVFSIDLLL